MGVKAGLLNVLKAISMNEPSQIAFVGSIKWITYMTEP